MNEQLVERLVLLRLASPSEPIAATSEDVAAALATAPHEGLVALLGAAIDSGEVSADGDARAAVEAAWTETMARCVQLDILLRAVSQRLTAAGIHHRALKGAAVASLDELQPAWRSYSDVDVLVPDGSLMAAVRVLAADELRPIVQPVSERWAERHAKSLTLVALDGTQVDLHRQLAPGVFGERLQLGALFRGGSVVALGDAEVLGLDAPHRFLHACYHASLGGVRGARHRRDILLLARSVGVGELAERWAEGWSATVVADALVFAAPRSVGLPTDWVEWLGAFEPSSSDAALLATYAGSFGDQAGAAMRVRGPWAAAQYAWPLLWPSRAHLRSRGRSRRQHLGSLLRARVVHPSRNRR